MPIYPYSFTMPPVNKQDIPSDGVVGEFLGISAGGVLDWLPVAGGGGGGDMLKADNLSGLADYAIARTNIGLGLTSSPEFANLTLTSPSLSSSAPVTISQTWGTLNATYTAFKVNATESATSNSASRLLDLQLGSVSLCNVNRIGSLSIGRSGQTFGSSVGSKIIINGWEPAGIEVDSHGGGGQGLAVLYYATQAAFTFGANGKTSAGGISIPSGGIVGWAAQSIGSSNSDTILLRDGAANTLALRNGAGVPQTFRVYNTFLGTTANEWFEIDWKVSAGTVRLFTMHGGTGVARNIDISAGATLFFGAGSGSPIKMYSGNVERWNISATGHFIAAADNSYDIGASGANRPRNVYVGSDVHASVLRAGIWVLNPSGVVHGTIRSESDGVFRITNSAINDFNRLQFGGTTNLFPAIKRNAAGLQIRLADDSANATLEAGNLYASGNVGIGTTSPTSKLDVAFSGSLTGLNLVSAGSTSVSNFVTWSTPWGSLSGGIKSGPDNGWTTQIFSNQQLSLSAGGVDSSDLLISAAGNVGIGTNAPTSKLDVIGTVTAESISLPAAGTATGNQQINAARIIYAGEGYRVGNTYQVVFSNGTDYSRGLGASSSGGLAVTNGSTGGQSLQFTEMTAPAAPATNSVRIYAEDNGSGKTRLMALFATGVAQQIAIEP